MGGKNRLNTSWPMYGLSIGEGEIEKGKEA